MSTFIWGKIKLNKKIIIDNYQRNSILVFFSDQKNDLFQDDLEDNEIFWEIALFTYSLLLSSISRETS